MSNISKYAALLGGGVFTPTSMQEHYLVSAARDWAFNSFLKCRLYQVAGCLLCPVQGYLYKPYGGLCV
jgi:hypothetical protein